MGFSGRSPAFPSRGARAEMKSCPAELGEDPRPLSPPVCPFWAPVRARMLLCVPLGGDTPNPRFARSPAPGMRGDEGSPHPRPKGAVLLLPQIFHGELLEDQGSEVGFEEGARSSAHTQPIFAGAPALAFLPLPRRFGTKCAGCSQGISPSDLVRKARNKVFHLNCFTCMVCNKQLSTGEELYIIDENKFVCKEDYLNSPSLKEGSLNSGTSGSARPPLRRRRRFLPAGSRFGFVG